MKLAAMLDPRLIFVDVPGNDRREIYREILRRAASVLPPLPIEETCRAMMAAEDALCIPGRGVAMPHLKCAETGSLYTIVAILRAPVLLHEYDEAPSRIVIMSLAPLYETEVYLKTLSALVRFLSGSVNREKLFAARSGEEVLTVLRESDAEVRKVITAAELLEPMPRTVRAGDALAAVWDILIRDRVAVVPVVDERGRLIGEVPGLEVVRRFIPQYMLMMENLTVLESIEPLSRMFRDEEQHRVADYMRPPSLVVTDRTPLVQFTVRMAREAIPTAFVVDDARRLLGVVTLGSIVRMMMRG